LDSFFDLLIENNPTNCCTNINIKFFDTKHCFKEPGLV
jgi:hypothetical protein